MRRTFLANLALVLVLNLLVKPFYILGIDAEVQERVGVEVYGGYAALLSLSFLLNILLDLGITNYNTRHVAQNEGSLQERLGGVLGIRLLLVLVYAVVTLFAGLVLGYGAAQLAMLGVLIFNQALAATLLYLRSNIAGAQRYAQDSLMSVLDRVLLIAMCAWLLWGRSGREFQIEWFVWAQTIAYGAAVLVALLLVARLGGKAMPKWQPELVAHILRASFPYALLVLLMTIYYRVDSVMLERMRPDGAAQAGIYAQGFRFFEALNMLGFLFAGLLLPMFSRMLKERADVAALVGLGWRLMLSGCLAVAVGGAWWGGAIMGLRYSDASPGAVLSFSLLMCCFTAVGTTYIFGTLLTARGDLRLLNWMAFGGMVLNVLLNLYMIPHHGAPGAALASLITQALTAAVQVGMVVRVFGMKPAVGPVLRGVIYLAAICALAFGLDHLSLGILPILFFFGSGAVLLAFATGLVRLPQVRSFLGPLSRP
ncbi:MAG: oligosaccharide flippase family protein [Flavobacteriales bacterium]